MEKKLLLVPLILVIGFSIACANDFSSSENHATVSIYRPNILIGRTETLEVTVNQHIRFILEGDEFFSFKVDPGTYLVHLADQEYKTSHGVNAFLIEVEAGIEYAVEVGFGSSFTNFLRVELGEADIDGYVEVEDYMNLRRSR